ncbi:unnamed protein product, partial [Prorocentrum cordatum]
DHLSAWSDMGAAATRKSPDLVLDISSSGGFQAVGAGFVLACGRSACTLAQMVTYTDGR